MATYEGSALIGMAMEKINGEIPSITVITHDGDHFNMNKVDCFGMEEIEDSIDGKFIISMSQYVLCVLTNSVMVTEMVHKGEKGTVFTFQSIGTDALQFALIVSKIIFSSTKKEPRFRIEEDAAMREWGKDIYLAMGEDERADAQDAAILLKFRGMKNFLTQVKADL